MIFVIILFTMAFTELTKPTSLYKWSAFWYDKIFFDVERITLLNVGVRRSKASIVCTFIKLFLDFSIHTLFEKESFYKCESLFFLKTYDYYLERLLKMLIMNFVRKIIGTQNWNEIKQLFQKWVGAPGSLILGAQSKPLPKPCSDGSDIHPFQNIRCVRPQQKGKVPRTHSSLSSAAWEFGLYHHICNFLHRIVMTGARGSKSTKGSSRQAGKRRIFRGKSKFLRK